MSHTLPLPVSGRFVRGVLLAGAAALALSGCSSLPVSGPTGNAVLKAAADPNATFHYQLVEVTDRESLPGPSALPEVEVPKLPPPPTDMIGFGDVLDVAVYEAGVALFAGGARPAGISTGSSFDGAAQVAHLPLQRVDDLGYIRLPYAGRLRAAGHTPAELATMIQNALKGLSQNPQVVVSVQNSIANSVIVGGEIGKPGRLVLTTNRETLSDVIALAGGYRGEAKDLSARITRGNRSFEYRITDALSGVDRDMRILPGDRVEVLRKPLTFAVMGAPGKVEQIGFSSAHTSLAEAVAMAGGANPYLGDAKAIFVFRYVTDEKGQEQAVVYHLNMMRPGAYFLSQRFAMRDKDLLYVGNAAANQPTKMVQLISQLFAPIATVQGALVNSGAL